MSIITLMSIFTLILSFLILIIRSFKGETTMDRVLALDLIGVTTISLFIIFFLLKKNTLFIDLALLMTFVSFVTALVFSTFLPSNHGEKK